MLLYDVTRPLSSALPVYPGDPVIDISPVAQRAWGDPANVSRVVLSSHSGTHLDAPRHFFDTGFAVDAVSLYVLLGPVRVVELTSVGHISPEEVQQLDLDGVTRVLFKTRNSALWELPDFQSDYQAFTPKAAQHLAEQPIQLVGIDYLSVDAFEASDFPVHRRLLGAGIVILEGLDLRDVPPGDYDLCALPLLLEDGDGAPARVVLRALP